MIKGLLKDSFNYQVKFIHEKCLFLHHNAVFSLQIDVIIPNLDTNFNDLIDLFSSYDYYLLTDITLDKLVDPLFIEAFVKNG